MNAHIRLVSSETVAEDANNHDAHENAEGRDEAPIGLPEEGGSNRNDVLGEAPPPLVAEPEDRAGGARNANARNEKGRREADRARLAAEAQGARAGGRRRRMRASGRRRRRPALRRLRSALTASRRRRPSRGTIILSWTTVRRDGAAVAAAAKAKRPVPKRKGALAVALAASVAIPAIVVLNWPRSAPQPVVEPGMLADGQTKVMAPSAALATAPPREAPNVSRDRPLVNETRRDELTEMMSFKGGDKAADGSTPKADAPAAAPSAITAQSLKAEPPPATAAPAAQPPVVAQAPETASPAPAHPASERSAVPPAAPEAASRRRRWTWREPSRPFQSLRRPRRRSSGESG